MKNYFLFIVLIFLTGCSYGYKDINLKNYSIKTKNINQYLIDKKHLVLYNEKEKTLTKITYKKFDNSVKKFSQYIYPIESEFIYSTKGIKYLHKLKKLFCNHLKIKQCIKNNLSDNYIIINNSKNYILKNDFGVKLYKAIGEYKKYLEDLEDYKDRKNKSYFFYK